MRSGSHPVAWAVALACAVTVRLTPPLVAVTVQVPPCSTTPGTTAPTCSVAAAASQSALVMNGCTARTGFAIGVEEALDTGVAASEGTALLADADTDGAALGASDGVVGSTTVVPVGAGVGCGADPIEHPATVASSAPPSSATATGRRSDVHTCSPTSEMVGGTHEAAGPAPGVSGFATSPRAGAERWGACTVRPS